MYGEEAKELALAPVGLARHRTKWPGREKGAKPLSAAQPRLSTKKKLGLPGCEAMRLRH